MLACSQRRLIPVLSGLRGSRACSGLQFHIQRGAIQAPASPIHTRHQVECTWTIRAADSSHHRYNARWPTTPRLERLKIQTPGLTVVRFRPDLLETIGNDLVAQVRVSSNAAKTLQAVEITPRYPNRTIVSFQRSRRDDAELFGCLLTEIEIPHAGYLQNLAAMGYGDVVVGDNVFINGDREATERRVPSRQERRRSRPPRASIQLLATNQSRLYVDAPSTAFQLECLKLASIGGSSLVQLDVGGLEISGSLSVGVVGGDEARADVFANTLVATHMKLRSIGNGSSTVSTHQHLDIDEVQALAIGDGSIDMLAPADCKTLCRSQRIAAVGSPCVDFASVPTSDASVKAVGSGDVLLNVHRSVRARTVGTTTIELSDRVPPSLDVRGFPSPRLIEAAATTASSGSYSKAPVPSINDAFDEQYPLQSGFTARTMWSRFHRNHSFYSTD